VRKFLSPPLKYGLYSIYQQSLLGSKQKLLVLGDVAIGFPVSICIISDTFAKSSQNIFGAQKCNQIIVQYFNIKQAVNWLEQTLTTF